MGGLDELEGLFQPSDSMILALAAPYHGAVRWLTWPELGGGEMRWFTNDKATLTSNLSPYQWFGVSTASPRDGSLNDPDTSIPLLPVPEFSLLHTLWSAVVQKNRPGLGDLQNWNLRNMHLCFADFPPHKNLCPVGPWSRSRVWRNGGCSFFPA